MGLLLLGLGAGACAQGSSSSASKTTGMAPNSHAAASGGAESGHAVSNGDRRFVEKAALGGQYEVDMGNAAQQKASNDEVKRFAERMVTDHTKADDQLKQAADSQGILAPAKLDEKHQKEMQKVEKASGAKFDQAYMRDMISDHKQAIALYEKEAKSGKDSAIKSYAEQTLPTLKEHLQMAEATQKDLKQSKPAASGSGK